MRIGSKKARDFALIQEESGIQVGISATLPQAGRHAAHLLQQQYDQWLERDRFQAWGAFKREHFCIALGGGNTIKAQYRAWLEQHHNSIDWLRHVRFFFLEETTGESGWESAEQSLLINFLVPLAHKLRRQRGIRALAKTLGLTAAVDEDDIIDAMAATMIYPINLAAARQALKNKQPRKARQLADQECQRYQQSIQEKLGATMAFHCIVSGIGKDGTIGALAPYMPELAIREPAALLLKKGSGAFRVALNRGVLVNAEQTYLIVSGSLNQKVLGRFELDETSDFEQTVLETPLRL